MHFHLKLHKLNSRNNREVYNTCLNIDIRVSNDVGLQTAFMFYQ